MTICDREDWILAKAKDVLRKSHTDRVAEAVHDDGSATSYNLRCFGTNGKPFFLKVPWTKLRKEGHRAIPYARATEEGRWHR